MNYVERGIEALTPSVEVRIDGTVLDEVSTSDLLDVTVVSSTTACDMFSLRLDAWEEDPGRFKWIDDARFQEGAEVEIRAGYDGPLTKLMNGEVVAQELALPRSGAITLTLRGYDRMHRLGVGRKTRVFRDVTDSQIVEQIAADWGLSAEVEDTRVVYPCVLQQDVTDRAFLEQRARRLHYEVGVYDRTLRLRPSNEAAAAVMSIVYRDDLLAFYPRLSTAGLSDTISVRGWDAAGKSAVEAVATVGDESHRMGGGASGPELARERLGTAPSTVTGEGVASAEEAELVARAHLDRQSLAFVTAHAHCIGNSLLQAGAVVEVSEVGERFSGPYYITEATHRLNASGYQTELRLMRNAI